MENVAVAGVGLGGTEMKITVITPNGEKLYEKKVLSRVKAGMSSLESNIVTNLIVATSSVQKQGYYVKAAGLGTPGLYKGGVVIGSAANIPGLDFYPLAKKVGDALGVDVIAANDATLQALAEYAFGEVPGARALAFLGLGTGVGASMLLDGKTYEGPNGLAGQTGHACIHYNGRKCTCGQRGCIEAYVSIRGTIMTFRQLRSRGKYATKYHPEVGKEDLKAIYDFAREGDALCVATVLQVQKHLAVAIADVAKHWNPDVLVVGGQMSKDFDYFGDILRNEVKIRLGVNLQRLYDTMQIVPAKFPAGGDSIGAAYLAYNTFVKK